VKTGKLGKKFVEEAIEVFARQLAIPVLQEHSLRARRGQLARWRTAGGFRRFGASSPFRTRLLVWDLFSHFAEQTGTDSTSPSTRPDTNDCSVFRTYCSTVHIVVPLRPG
jgi:hypothetical protein